MIQDQMTLFAAPAAQTESPPSGHKQARKPARARTRAGDEVVAAPLALPLVTPACELRDETAATFSRLGATAPNIPTRRPSIPSLEATPPMPETTDTQPPTPAIDDAPAAIRTDRLWQLDGWTARVIKNQDDDGWAVEMLKDGEAEPALVGPWTMGRDKKNPKPLDVSAFNTLVKTASEVLRRHEQHLQQIAPALRVQVMRLLYQVTPEYTQVSFVPDEAASFDVPVEWTGLYYPAYIPEGYEFYGVGGSSSMPKVLFNASEDRFLRFSEYSLEAESNINSEGYTVEEADINGAKGVLSWKDGHTILVWPVSDRFFILDITAAADTAMEIARSVTRVK